MSEAVGRRGAGTAAANAVVLPMWPIAPLEEIRQLRGRPKGVQRQNKFTLRQWRKLKPIEYSRNNFQIHDNAQMALTGHPIGMPSQARMFFFISHAPAPITI